MSEFNWNVQLPLYFGQAETPPMSLLRALPGDEQKASSSNVFAKPTAPTSVISCQSCLA